MALYTISINLVSVISADYSYWTKISTGTYIVVIGTKKKNVVLIDTFFHRLLPRISRYDCEYGTGDINPDNNLFFYVFGEIKNYTGQSALYR